MAREMRIRIIFSELTLISSKFPVVCPNYLSFEEKNFLLVENTDASEQLSDSGGKISGFNDL